MTEKDEMYVLVTADGPRAIAPEDDGTMRPFARAIGCEWCEAVPLGGELEGLVAVVDEEALMRRPVPPCRAVRDGRPALFGDIVVARIVQTEDGGAFAPLTAEQRALVAGRVSEGVLRL